MTDLEGRPGDERLLGRALLLLRLSLVLVLVPKPVRARVGEVEAGAEVDAETDVPPAVALVTDAGDGCGDRRPGISEVNMKWQGATFGETKA